MDVLPNGAVRALTIRLGCYPYERQTLIRTVIKPAGFNLVKDSG